MIISITSWFRWKTESYNKHVIRALIPYLSELYPDMAPKPDLPPKKTKLNRGLPQVFKSIIRPSGYPPSFRYR